MKSSAKHGQGSLERIGVLVTFFEISSFCIGFELPVISLNKKSQVTKVQVFLNMYCGCLDMHHTTTVFLKYHEYGHTYCTSTWMYVSVQQHPYPTLWMHLKCISLTVSSQNWSQACLTSFVLTRVTMWARGTDSRSAVGDINLSRMRSLKATAWE